MKIPEFLYKDEPLNISIIEPLRLGYGKIIYETENSAVVHINDNIVMISAIPEEFDELFKHVESGGLFVVDREEYIEKIGDKFGNRRIMKCYNVIYTSSERIIPDNKIKIEPLKPCNIDEVCKHYHTVSSPEYIAYIISKNEMFGAFDGDKLTGYIGIHEEGSMGLLEVFPEYRKRGIGSRLEAFLINYQLDKGRVPFGQVVEGNLPSMNLQKKTGMSVADKPVYWVLE